MQRAEREEGARFKYAFKFLARSDAHDADNEPAVTINVQAGKEDHLVFCGTLTMSEAEWEALSDHLQLAGGESLEIEAG